MPTKQTIEQWGLQRDTKSVPQLIETLNTNTPLRWDAAWALGQIADRSAVPHLMQILDDSDPNVRKRAAYSLGEIGDTSILNDLQGRQTDDDRHVQQGIEWALERLTEIEQERQERERQEQERQAQLERERQERERQEQERQERERQAQLEREQQERERQERERQERERQAQLERERQERRTKTLAFGVTASEIPDSDTLLRDYTFTNKTVRMENLEKVIIHAEKAKASLLKSFFRYAESSLEEKLRNNVNVTLKGNFNQLASLSELQGLFSNIESDVEGLVFGEGEALIEGLQGVLHDCDFGKVEVKIKMPKLQQLIVHANAKSEWIDNFEAYASQHFGQKFLEEDVHAKISKELEPRILNKIKGLCKTTKEF